MGGGDRNLFVNSISAGATVIPANDSSVTYTVPSCNGYYSGVGTLACSGDLVSDHYATATAQTITVNAYGSPDYNIYPHMQVLVNGVVLGEWDVSGTAQNYTVTVPSPAVHYYLADQLGSADVVTNASGAIEEDSEYYPFGGERVYTDTLGDQNSARNEIQSRVLTILAPDMTAPT